MKLLICLIVALLAALAVAQRSSIETSPMEWSSPTQNPYGITFPVRTTKDLLIYPAVDNGQPYLSVRRRNSQGSYVQIANFTENFATSAPIFTNGNWVGMLGVTPGVITLFNVNNNQMSATSFIPIASGYLLSDDTLVGFDPVPLDDGNFTIRTYEYNAANMDWTEVASAALTIPFATGVVVADLAFYRAYDNHLLIADNSGPEDRPSSIRIYERQADLSWDLIENVPVNKAPSSIYYNGIDTLVAFALNNQDQNAPDFVYIYTKTNGEWAEQLFTTASVGYRPIGYLGLSVAFVGANNILLSAGLEGSLEENPNRGTVLLVTRNSTGLWEPALDLVGSNLFGLGVGVNDYDIIITSLLASDETDPVLTFHTAPLCIAEPINVTCIDQQATSCSDISLEELYTVNNPQCGGPVSVRVSGFSLVNNQAVSAQLSFTRGYGIDFSCAPTVTCPAPPVAEVVPVSDTKVSGSNVLQFGLASVLAYAAVLL